MARAFESKSMVSMRHSYSAMGSKTAVGLSRFVIRKLRPELQSLGSPAWARETVSVLSVNFIAYLYNTKTGDRQRKGRNAGLGSS